MKFKMIIVAILVLRFLVKLRFPAYYCNYNHTSITAGKISTIFKANKLCEDMKLSNLLITPFLHHIPLYSAPFGSLPELYLGINTGHQYGPPVTRTMEDMLLLRLLFLTSEGSHDFITIIMIIIRL